MEQVTQKIIGVLVAITLWTGFIMTGNANAKDSKHAFYAAEVITMDVVKQDGIGSSGTYWCKDFATCYLLVLSGEYRNKTDDCKTVTIKRNGHAIWSRDYNNPYWTSLQQEREFTNWYN